MFKIALAWPVTESEFERLRSYVRAECSMVAPRSFATEHLIEVAKDADVIVGSYVPQAMIDGAPRLKMVQLLSSGVTHVALDGSDAGFTFESLRARNILLGNVAGANAVAVAEHAFALMITLAKHIIPAHQAIVRGEWYPYEESTLGCELAAKTLGIVGLGAIGVALAKRAQAFDMRVIANKRTPAPQLVAELGLDFLGAPDDLGALLQESDFVVLSLPWMPATDELIGEAELALMKRRAYLVNIARANLVDEFALYRALKERRIAGFGTDVWWQYDRRPRLADSGRRLAVSEGGDPNGYWRSRTNTGICAPAISRSGIHQLDNVVLTGDKAAWNPETSERFPIVALENVSMLARGETPTRLVGQNPCAEVLDAQH